MWRFARRFGVLSLALALFGAPAQAQVVARQGEETNKPTEFASPMVLELPFAKVIKFAEGTGKAFDDLTKFVCDDTTITRLFVKKVRASAKRGDRYAFNGNVFVRRSHDRLVTLTLDILVGSDVLASATKSNINAEENTSRQFNLQLNLNPEQTAILAANSETAVLRINVKVEDNS